MTTEAIESQQVEEATQDDAGFAAGFAEARGEEPPVEAAPEVKDRVDTEQSGQTATPEETPAQNLIAGLTEDQLKNLLMKANSIDDVNARVEKAFGKVGELNRTILELQKNRGNGAGLSVGQLKRLSGEYPELAELLASDLSEAFSNTGGGSPGQQFDPSMIEQPLADKVKEVERNFEKRLLRKEHKDWEETVTSDDFKLWGTNVLPREEWLQLNASWDSEFIAEKLTEFKAWKQQATAQSESQTNTQREQKQKRLEAAVTPTSGRTNGPNIQSEDDAFASGFSQVRSNRLY